MPKGEAFLSGPTNSNGVKIGRDWKQKPLTNGEHIAADIRAGRFPERSSPSVAMAEIEKHERKDSVVALATEAVRLALQRQNVVPYLSRLDCSAIADAVLEIATLERDAYRVLAVEAGWSNALAESYGHVEYRRQREAFVDEMCAALVSKGITT